MSEILTPNFPNRLRIEPQALEAEGHLRSALVDYAASAYHDPGFDPDSHSILTGAGVTLDILEHNLVTEFGIMYLGTW